jgi:hypothetical protein
MAKSIDLYIDQGSDFLVTLPAVTAANGSVVDLTTYTAVCQIRRSYASLDAVQLVVTIPNPSNGIIVLSLVKTETVGLTPTRYVYDVVITDANGKATKVFEGLMVVNPGVSGKPNTTLLTPYVPDDYGGL